MGLEDIGGMPLLKGKRGEDVPGPVAPHSFSKVILRDGDVIYGYIAGVDKRRGKMIIGKNVFYNPDPVMNIDLRVPLSKIREYRELMDLSGGSQI